MSHPRVAAIEGGGTKFVVGVGTTVTDATITTIPTTTPEATAAAVLAVLRKAFDTAPFEAIGVASFGPLGIVPNSPEYGVIAATPKPGWRGFNYLDCLAEFQVPIVVDTDVNCAALAEARQGAGKNHSRVMYVTVGTGIGGGLVIDEQISTGASHPEIGHITLARHPHDLPDAGICPFHKDCLEGFASGPSIHSRWHQSLSQLASDHFAHRLEAYYLGQMCANLLLSMVPDMIVIGGGVSNSPGLIARVQQATRALLNGYLPALDSDTAMAQRISLPSLAPLSGLVGAFELSHSNKTSNV